MLITTTPTVEGRNIIHYRGLVTGEAIIGANIFRDMLASMTDIIGGRSRAYEQALEKARQVATEEMVGKATAMKANAVIGVDIDYEVFGEGGMMMVSLSGTAVCFEAVKHRKGNCRRGRHQPSKDRVKFTGSDQNQLAGLKPGPGITGVPPLQKLEANTSLSCTVQSGLLA